MKEKISGIKPFTIFLRRFASAVLVLSLLIAVPSDSALAASLKAAEGPSQDDIVLYAQEHPTDLASYSDNGIPLGDYTIGYRVKPQLTQPYAAGALCDEELTCALNTVKTIRYIAGLSDDVYLSDRYNSLAQASSLVNYVNNKLTHTPSAPAGMDSALASDGYTGSSKSNIAWTSWRNCPIKWTIIHGWMDDDSSKENISSLGHRRWILNPYMGMTGFGAVTGSNGTYSTMYAHDMSNLSGSKTGAVCWPATNTPLSYFGSDAPWSISLGYEISDDVIEKVKISMLRGRDSKTWTFSKFSSDGDFYVNNGSFGEKGCIIFRPSDVGSYDDGDSFYVSVSLGDTGETMSYTVDFFDLEGYYDPEAPVLSAVKLNSLDKPRITWLPVDDADSYNLYRKTRGGSWKLIADNLEDCIYEDASAGRGIRYYYNVTAAREVNDTIYESDPSSSKYVTVPLSKARITSAKSTARGTNYIKWSSVSKASGYKVYRRTAGSSKWTLVKTTRSLYFKDTKKTSGRKYEYRVRAYRTYNSYTTYGDYSTIKTVRTR
ncbi:MAG: hypothetical protein ACI4LP_11130 [Anaerovoracaceae bacterium]